MSSPGSKYDFLVGRTGTIIYIEGEFAEVVFSAHLPPVTCYLFRLRRVEDKFKITVQPCFKVGDIVRIISSPSESLSRIVGQVGRIRAVHKSVYSGKSIAVVDVADVNGITLYFERLEPVQEFKITVRRKSPQEEQCLKNACPKRE